jgi:nucleotide-binding universal stress UspA family protein
MKVLIAIDGSPCSDAAIVEVCRRPWPAGSEFRLITVDPQLDVKLGREGSPFDEVLQQQRLDVTKRLDAGTALFRRQAPQLPLTSVLREGWPKEAIVDEAEEWGADLVVVGSHGYGAVKRFLLGSVSMAVVLNAPCSVEIVRLPQSSTAAARSSAE